MNVREEKKPHSWGATQTNTTAWFLWFREFKYACIFDQNRKKKRLIKEPAHFFDGIEASVYSLMCREELLIMPFFKITIPVPLSLCNLLPCSILCHLLVMQELSFHHFLCGSSASCQLCSSRSFRATIDARRCQSILKPIQLRTWMKPAGGWLFPERRMDDCCQIKVHSANVWFSKTAFRDTLVWLALTERLHKWSSNDFCQAQPALFLNYLYIKQWSCR